MFSYRMVLLANNRINGKGLKIQLDNKFLCNLSKYKNIYDQISQHEDIKEVIIDSLMKVMEHYENS